MRDDFRWFDYTFGRFVCDDPERDWIADQTDPGDENDNDCGCRKGAPCPEHLASPRTWRPKP